MYSLLTTLILYPSPALYPLFFAFSPVLAGYAIHVLINPHIMRLSDTVLFPIVSGNSCTVGLVSHALSFLYHAPKRTLHSPARENSQGRKEAGVDLPLT